MIDPAPTIDLDFLAGLPPSPDEDLDAWPRGRGGGQGLGARGVAALRRRIPAPSLPALAGILVLVLIAVGAVHLAGRGTAVPGGPGVPDEAVLVAGTAGGGGAVSGNPASDTPATAPTSAEPGPSGAAGADPTGAATVVTVHVSGAVAEPGVHALPAGSRVDDAVRAAGGGTGEADLDALNLARPLVDGEQIHVPTPGESPPVAAEPGAPDAAGGSGGGQGTGTSSGGAEGSGGVDGAGVVDINTAGVTELDALPGVGPAIAARIVEHRETNGPFASVDDLEQVSGIGPATLEKIRPMATV